MPDEFRIGLILPGGGSPAMHSPTFQSTAELAAHEVNARGGVLGRAIELTPIKMGPNALHDAEELRTAIAQANPHGLVVLHDSNVREITAQVVGGRIPIYYPAIWEGGCEPSGVICTGESPDGKVWPSIEWLARNAAATDWMIVGTDYLWPSGTVRAIEPRLRRRGWWHGTHLVPYSLLDDLDGDERVVRQLIDAVDSSSASCVLVLLHGTQMAMFNREFAARGLDHRVLRFAPMADEAVLLASGPDSTRGLLTSFGVIDGDRQHVGEVGFLERYSQFHGGKVPQPTGVTLVGYEGVMVACSIADRLGHIPLSADDLLRVRRAGFAFQAPTGQVRVRGDSILRPLHLLAVDGVELTSLARLS